MNDDKKGLIGNCVRGRDDDDDAAPGEPVPVMALPIEIRERIYSAARLLAQTAIVTEGGRGSLDELDRALALHFFTMGARWQFNRQEDNPFETIDEQTRDNVKAANAAWAREYEDTLKKHNDRT